MMNHSHLLNSTVSILLCLGFLFQTGFLITSSQAHTPLLFDLNEDVELLILAPCEFTEELQPLIAHKNSYDISCKLVSLHTVYDAMYWQGRDHAEKIKYFIKNAHEYWNTEYVLLVGGLQGQGPKWYCPVRYVLMDDNWEDRYISDLYFADIYESDESFSSWDSDGDDLYGEWYYEEPADDINIDLEPDIAVGRLPCRSPFEVTIMVDKIITYETLTYGQSWFDTFVCIAGDTYPVMYNPNWTGNEGEYYCDRAIENMTGFTPIRLYTSDGSLSKERDVINTLNNGCGFVYFNGHGNPQTWGNHPPDSEEFITGLTTKTISLLRNGEKMPICLVGGCHNSQFDVNIYRFFEGLREMGLQFFQYEFYKKEWVPECWGWRMTRKIGGGSIATLGCSALGYTKEDKDSFVGGLDEVEGQFFVEYRHHGHTVLGDAWKAAVSSYVNHYPIDWFSEAVSDSWIDAKVAQSWALFGDPSLQIGGYAETPCSSS